MKKIGKMVLMMMLAMPMLGINVTAATTENPDGRAVMNPCDDILQPGEYAQFSPRNSGMTSYRVDKVDAAKDLIYNNKLKIKNGLFLSYSLIQCDKVAIVHTNKSNEDMEIIIITPVRYKNKKLHPISKDFMRKNKEAADEYLRIKKIRQDCLYYFQVINCGELNKYVLLDNIYRNCVNAVYTSSAIENIKIARGQKEI